MPVPALAISAQNTFTAPQKIREHGTLIITGTFVANVILQCSQDGVSNWTPTSDGPFTAPGVYTFTDFTGQWYQAGVATGGYTSGTANVTLRGE